MRQRATLQPRVPAPSRRHFVCVIVSRSRVGRSRHFISLRLRSTEDSASLGGEEEGRGEEGGEGEEEGEKEGMERKYCRPLINIARYCELRVYPQVAINRDGTRELHIIIIRKCTQCTCTSTLHVGSLTQPYFHASGCVNVGHSALVNHHCNFTCLVGV